jgi:hypothetical protein
MKGFKPQAANVAELTEKETGLRFCIACNKLVPLDQFRTDKRKYTCIPHYRAAGRKAVLGSHEKRAFNSLRCRARQDMLLLGHKRLIINHIQVTAMLTSDQMANFSNYCLIPKRPDHPLSVDNSIIVASEQRKYVIGNWKRSRDTEKYVQDLHFILGSPKHVAP